jgi:splicing factor 3B subunit 3
VAGPEFSAEVAAELDQFGALVGAPGQWASCIRLVDPAGVQCVVQHRSSNTCDCD